MKIGFSQPANELLSKIGADPAKISQKALEKLDQDHNGTITDTELKGLDFNQDQHITRFELQDFELNERELVFPSPASGKPSAPAAMQKPEILPDVTYEGPPIIEVNNPEKIPKPGLVFDSIAQSKSVTLGVDPREFNYYSYANLDLDNKSSTFQGQTAYQAIVLTNNGEEDVLIDISGSGYANSRDPLDIPGLSVDEKKAMDNNTRRADYKLEGDMLNGSFQLQGKGVKIPKGGSIVVYTRIDNRQGESDMRAGYEFRVTSPPADRMKKGLDMRVAVTTTSPGVPKLASRTGSCGIVESPPAGLLEKPEFKQFVPAEGHLRPGTDFTSPAGVATAGTHWKDLLRSAPAELTKNKRTALLEQRDLDGLMDRLNDIEQLANKPGAQMSEIMPALEKWNQELKVMKRVLENKKDLLQAAYLANPSDAGSAALKREDARIKPEIDLLNGISVSLGRVNGIKEHSEIHSNITMNLPADGLKRVFALVTNPLNTAGASETQMMKMRSITQFPTGETGQTRPSNFQQESVGNYGVRYAVTLNLNNSGDTPLDIRALFGSPGEHGSQLPVSESYQPGTSYMKDWQTRFTGQIKISPEKGQPFFVNVVHGKVEMPQDLMDKHPFTLPAHGQQKLKIEFVVPTNNTGPHLLHINAEPQPL